MQVTCDLSYMLLKRPKNKIYRSLKLLTFVFLFLPSLLSAEPIKFSIVSCSYGGTENTCPGDTPYIWKKPGYGVCDELLKQVVCSNKPKSCYKNIKFLSNKDALHAKNPTPYNTGCAGKAAPTCSSCVAPSQCLASVQRSYLCEYRDGGEMKSGTKQIGDVLCGQPIKTKPPTPPSVSLSNPLAMFKGAEQLSLFYFSDTMEMNELYVDRDNAWSSRNISASTPTWFAPFPNSALTSVEGNSVGSIFYLDLFKQVNQVYYESNSNSWKIQAIPVSANEFAVAAQGSDLTSFVNSSGIPFVFYLDSNNHIHQLYYSGHADTWKDINLTKKTGTSGAIAGSALTSFAGEVPSLFYIDTNHNVNQIFFNGSSWENVNITQASGAPSATPGSDLTSFASGVTSVFYVGKNQHIYQLLYTGSEWSYVDISKKSSAADAQLDTALTSIVGDLPSVFYYDANANIHQIFYNENLWTHVDVTEQADSNSAANTKSLTSFSSRGIPSVFYYDANKNIHQLVYNNNNWTDTNLMKKVADQCE